MPLTQAQLTSEPPALPLPPGPPVPGLPPVREPPVDGAPPYLVRFRDGRKRLLYPGPDAVIEIDADQLHFAKLSLRSSMASPGVHAASSMRILETMPELGEELISHRFTLDELPDAFARGSALEEKPNVVKMVMVGGGEQHR